MLRFSILLGSAPEDYRQKKIEDMFDFLDSKRSAGDSIVAFANGISEIMLEMVLDNSVKQLADVAVGPVVTEPRRSIEIIKPEIHHCDVKCSEAESVLENEVEDCRGKPDDDTNLNNLRPSEKSAGDSFTENKTNSIFLYICTLQPVGESEESIWLGGEEIRKDVIEHYQELAAECGIDMQVVLDSDGEMVREEKLGYEEVGSLTHSAVKIRNE